MSTPKVVPVLTGVEELKLVNFRPDVLLTPELISKDVVGAIVPIPTLSFAASTESVVPSTENPLVAVEVKAKALDHCATVVGPDNDPLPL